MSQHIDPARLTVGTTIRYRWTAGGDDCLGVIARAPFNVGFFQYVAIEGPATIWIAVDNIRAIEE